MIMERKTIEILATIITAAGFFMLSEGAYLQGFILSLAGNAFWISWALPIRGWGLIGLNAFLAVSSLNGLLNI